MEDKIKVLEETANIFLAYGDNESYTNVLKMISALEKENHQKKIIEEKEQTSDYELDFSKQYKIVEKEFTEFCNRLGIIKPPNFVCKPIISLFTKLCLITDKKFVMIDDKAQDLFGSMAHSIITKNNGKPPTLEDVTQFLEENEDIAEEIIRCFDNE